MKRVTLIEIFVFLLINPVLPQDVDSDWQTHFEKSGFISTPGYKETMDYFQKFADSSDFAELFSFGKSPQGRELKYLLVTKEEEKQRKIIAQNYGRDLQKPVILIINGIHSGEIEGKDASMLLLREILITKEKEYLLDSINIIVIPIFNVDGHERKSKYNRINQNGPEEMGWRTTAQNLNLNRDWMKAETPEMQSMLRLFNQYLPDFIIDTHTTNGADYQYTITYSVEWSKNIFSKTAAWLKDKFIPFLEKGVEEDGFLIHPYVFLKNWITGFDEGIIYWPATPRFSTGYSALQNRPCLLVETHMLKPYKDRVYSTKAILETTLDFAFTNSSELNKLNKEADEHAINFLNETNSFLPLKYSNSNNAEAIKFKGYEYYFDSSTVSGIQKLVYTDKKKDFNIKYFNDVMIDDSVKVPKGYLIPFEWISFFSEHFILHGIKSEVRSAGEEFNVEKYRFYNIKYDTSSNEGKQRVNFDFTVMKEKIILDKNFMYIPTNQRTMRVIVNLLEPKSADSFVRWGFMNQIFEQKEYYEEYVMEKLAEEMMTNNPELKKEFEEKLKSDEAFRNKPRARLDFFYYKSPYPDKQKDIFPILRVLE